MRTAEPPRSTHPPPAPRALREVTAVLDNRTLHVRIRLLVQQFQRMDMSLEQGVRASRVGELVSLATRCSVHCKTDADAWDVVGLFNFENAPQERSVEWSSIGLPDDADAAVFEFWQERFVGLHKGRVTMTLPPQLAVGLGRGGDLFRAPDGVHRRGL